MGHLQVVILTFGVAIQYAGYFMFVRVWAGERDLVTVLLSTISFLCTYMLLWAMLQFVYLILVLSYLVTVIIFIQILICYLSFCLSVV